MTRTQRADAPQGLLARRIRSLTDVELGEGEPLDRGTVNALVTRHVASSMPPAALAVPPEAFDHLLAVLPPQPDQPERVRRTVGLAAGGLAETLDAALPCLEKGAAELQLVLTAESFLPLEEDSDPAFTLMRDLKLACGPRVPLKVLFQGPEFALEERLAEAVDAALQGGADIIGLDLESLGLPPGPDGALDAALRLTALLSEADRAVGLKFRGGSQRLAALEEAKVVLRLAGRFLGSSHPDASQLRFSGPALDDTVLTLLRREQGGRG